MGNLVKVGVCHVEYSSALFVIHEAMQFTCSNQSVGVRVCRVDQGGVNDGNNVTDGRFSSGLSGRRHLGR